MIDVSRLKPYIPHGVGSVIYLIPHGGYLLNFIGLAIDINSESYKKMVHGYVSTGVIINTYKSTICFFGEKTNYEQASFISKKNYDSLSIMGTGIVATFLHFLGENKLNLNDFAGAFAAQPVDDHVQ